MKGSWKFSAVAGGVVLALIIFYAFVVGPTAKEAEDERTSLKNLKAKRNEYVRADGVPIAEAEDLMKAQQVQIAELKKGIGHVKLAVPPELQPQGGRDRLYFQKQLADLSAAVAADGIRFAERVKNLGFVPDVTDDRIAEMLARVAVARRFYAAAKAAQVTTVNQAENLDARTKTRADASVEVNELVYKVTVATDERGLIRLVQELSRPKDYLALAGLEVAVKDPASGTFEATLEVAGVTTRRIGEGEPAGQKTETPGRAPTTPARPRRF